MDLMILIIEIMCEKYISHLNLNLRDNEIALIKCMYYVEGFIEGYIEGFVEGFVVGFVLLYWEFTLMVWCTLYLHLLY